MTHPKMFVINLKKILNRLNGTYPSSVAYSLLICGLVTTYTRSTGSIYWIQQNSIIKHEMKHTTYMCSYLIILIQPYKYILERSEGSNLKEKTTCINFCTSIQCSTSVHKVCVLPSPSMIRSSSLVLLIHPERYTTNTCY